jgi:hypothetical protein
LTQASAIRHSAEEVIDMPNAPGDRCFHLLEGGVRVAGVAANAAFPAGADERFRAGQFRGDGRGGNAIGMTKILLVFRSDWGTNGRGGVATARFKTEVGTIEVRAEDARAPRSALFQSTACFEESEMLIVARDGGGRQKAGGSMACMGTANGPKGFRVAVHEVRAVAAVDVQVNEAGDEVAALKVDAIAAGCSTGTSVDGPYSGILYDHDSSGQEPILKNERAAVESQGSHEGSDHISLNAILLI